MVSITVPLKFFNELLKAVIDSKSRWFVGSSNINTLALIIIIRLSIQRTFSPPDKTLLVFKASSPLNNIFPKKPRINTSSLSSSVFAYCLNQSTSVRSLSKYSELSKNEVIIVQAAKGGSSLTVEAEQNNWGNWDERGKLFSSSLQKINKALEDSKFKKVDAIFWSQGENDGAAIFLGKISKKVYKTSLKKLIKRFREKFKDVPFIIIETGSFEGDESKSNCYQQIREAQREVAEEMENVYIGYNETEFFIERGWLKDVVHYNQIALNDIGEKLAYFYYSLEN